ncbi:hypothetical protein [Streptomyces sp. NPDC059863]|uniref:hypothetical protein n=1 Tax=unclassified Streptomyces TaxID=2593676 RepID=UPI00365AF0B8
MTDDDGSSYLAQLADEMEAVQLTAGETVLGHAAEMLAPSRALSRDQNGHLALTLQIARLGGQLATAPLVLTLVDAERLHAALCYALDGKPVPADAPECRKSIQYSGGRQRF